MSSSKPLSPPGFWPGFLELVYFFLLTVLAAVIADEFDGTKVRDGAGFHTFAASILTTIVYLIVGRRHRKRAGVEGDGPFFRIRDLAVLTVAGTMAPLLGYQIVSAEQLSKMGGDGETTVAATFFFAVLNMFFTSKVWGALTGPRSVAWGVLALLGGAVTALVMVLVLTSDMMSMFGGGGYLIGIAQLLLGLAYVVGGLALFKEPSERVAAASNVSAAIGGAWGLFAAGDLYLLANVMSGEKSDMQAMMGAPIVPTTLLYVYATVGVLRHRASLKAAVPPTPAGA